MRLLAIAVSVLIVAVDADMQRADVLDNILVYPIPAPASALKIQKRETAQDPTEKFREFVEEKLTQHTQAFEHVIKRVDSHAEILKQLIDHLSKTLEKPKLPEKVDSPKVKPQIERRSYNVEENENPILRLGKNIPIYGRLAKDIFMKEIQTDTDPTPLVERDPDVSSVLESTRRSGSGDNSGVDRSQQIKDEPSPWCELAMLCQKTAESICGFDDNFGYGKFDDMCHMLHVNCYYKYNFVLAHTCRPTF